MRFHEFISDRMGKIILEIIILSTSLGILFATGTQPDLIVLLLVLICLIRMTAFLIEFFKCRSYLAELENILSGLDRKYLFVECIPLPKTIYERKLFSIMRRSYKSMTEAVSDAEAARREYREYVESWVHEIKSPITAAKLICHGIDSTPRRRLTQELTQIEAHVERALFYARAETPEKDFIIQEYNLEEIVSEAVGTYSTLLMQNNIRIETENLHHQIYTDSKWTCFILGQLLQNAARYKTGHSSFTRFASQTQPIGEQFSPNCDTPIIFISAEPLNNEQLLLTVADNGMGIPAHELPRVFDRGFTGSNGRVRGGSTGMGLYLCRRLSTFLGIDIQIVSVEQEGTCVTLTFPAKNLYVQK